MGLALLDAGPDSQLEEIVNTLKTLVVELAKTNEILAQLASRVGKEKNVAG